MEAVREERVTSSDPSQDISLRVLGGRNLPPKLSSSTELKLFTTENSYLLAPPPSPHTAPPAASPAPPPVYAGSSQTFENKLPDKQSLVF